MPLRVLTPSHRAGGAAHRLTSLLSATVALSGSLGVVAASPAAAMQSATITGYVAETGRVPTTGMDVYLWTAAGVFVSATVTDSGGVYVFPGIEPGVYKVEFENQQEATAEWYDNSPDMAGAAVIEVGKGEVAEADAYLTTGSENITLPTIAGSPAVGSTLTASLGQWFPTPSAGFAYQWLRNGNAVDGATGTSYVLGAADSGATMRVRVTADNMGTRESATSAPTTVVSGGTPGAIVPVAPPAVTGPATVGSTLTAGRGTWSPVDVTVAYQWLRNGSAINGATTDTLTLLPADLGASVSVRTTASRTGATPVAQTSSTVVVGLGAFVTAQPSVTGDATVGRSLVATAGAWSPTPATTSYTWRDADSGATLQTGGPTFLLTTTHLGRRVEVVVTGLAHGYAPAVRTAGPTARVTEAGLTSIAAPTVSGTTRVGSSLRATGGSWSATPDSRSYVWLRNGRVIAGGTGASYRILPVDAGMRLAVRVTAARGGLTSVATSSSTAAVSKARSELRLSGTVGRGTARVVAQVSSAGARTGAVTVSVSDRGRTLTRRSVLRSGRATVRFTGLGAGRKVFRVTYSGSGSAAAASATWKARVR